MYKMIKNRNRRRSVVLFECIFFSVHTECRECIRTRVFCGGREGKGWDRRQAPFSCFSHGMVKEEPVTSLVHSRVPLASHFVGGARPVRYSISARAIGPFFFALPDPPSIDHPRIDSQ